MPDDIDPIYLLLICAGAFILGYFLVSRLVDRVRGKRPPPRSDIPLKKHDSGGGGEVERLEKLIEEERRRQERIMADAERDAKGRTGER